MQITARLTYARFATYINMNIDPVFQRSPSKTTIKKYDAPVS